jgi:hypothetical protein
VAEVLFGAFVLGLCFYVGRTWLRWFRAEPTLVFPKWRSGITAFGFSACTVSLVTILLLIVYATASSSITPFDPISVTAYRTIFVTSLLAIFAGIVGKGPLETPTFVCSILCLLVLAIAGFAS